MKLKHNPQPNQHEKKRPKDINTLESYELNLFDLKDV